MCVCVCVCRYLEQVEVFDGYSAASDVRVAALDVGDFLIFHPTPCAITRAAEVRVEGAEGGGGFAVVCVCVCVFENVGVRMDVCV